jgi:hypothetical protein
MSKELLYVVNTNIDSLFTNPFINDSLTSSFEDHARFVLKVQEQIPNFNSPYLALFSKGGYFVSDNIRYPGGDWGGIGTLGKPLEDYIEELIIGDETIWNGRVTPITAVVEFSPMELYPRVMEQLGKKYDIKRFLVN